MRRIKASVTALIIAVILFIYVYKPVEHEQHAESPTESSQMIPPADDVAPIAPPPKPIIPPVAKAEAKAESKPAAKAVNKPVVKAESKPVAKTVNKPVVKTKEKKRKSDEYSTFKLTHYTSSCRGCSGITYEGYDVRNTIYVNSYRVVAVDKDVIPLGSVIEIKYEDGRTIKALAADIGGGVNGNHVDLLVNNRSEALKLGRKAVKVRIISGR